MKRETRSVTVEVEVDVDLCTLTFDEARDVRECACKILRVCQLVPEEPMDRKAVREQAEYILNLLEDLK